MRTKCLPAFLMVCIVALCLGSGAAIADDIAWDMVGTTNHNLFSYSNSAPPFTSVADGFQKYQVGVSATIPFSVLDDSAMAFPGDTLGIIDSNSNLQEFFGATDTENADNSGIVSATWVFDISTAVSNLALSVDLGAMGDFEAASDQFDWTYQVDAGPVVPVFTATVNEAIDHTYIMAGGAPVTLNDPLEIGGVVVDNVLQTFSTPIATLGSTLTVVLNVTTNGGDEAYAAQNLLVTGDVPVELMSFSVE